MSILENFQVEVIKFESNSKYDDDLIVQKYPKEDFANGSVLIVPPSMSAVFINYVSAGSSIDATGKGNAQVSVFAGPKEYRLETGESRFAPFRRITNSLTGNVSAFHSEVYFVKNIHMTDLTWGTGFEMTDPETHLIIHVGSSGRMGVHIENDPAVCAQQVRKFIEKIVGTRDEFTKSDLVNFFDEKIKLEVPDMVANYMEANQLGILHMTTKMKLLSEAIHQTLCGKFDEFGVSLDSFSFNNISAKESDIAKLKKAIEDATAETYITDMRSAAEARKRAREGYTYQQEKSFEVLGAAAANKGTPSQGMGLGIGLGMGGAMGGIFGSGIAAMANNTFNAPGSITQGQNAVPVQPNAGAPNYGYDNTAPQNSKFRVQEEPKQNQGPFCPECGKPVPAGSKFCPECGFRLVKVCPNCGKEVSGKFCGECGTKIE